MPMRAPDSVLFESSTRDFGRKGKTTAEKCIHQPKISTYVYIGGNSVANSIRTHAFCM